MKSHSTTVRLMVALILAALGTATALIGPQSATAATVPVSLRIIRFTQIDDPDPLPLQGDGDYYVRAKIGPLPETGSVVEVENDDFQPDLIPDIAGGPWTFGGNVDLSLSPISITIEFFDKDLDTDDVIDLNPVDGVTSLTIMLDLHTGEWTGDWTPFSNRAGATGDGDTEHFSDGGQRGRVLFALSTLSLDGDADGDGLLDSWELFGFDADGNLSTDVPLHQMGADPLHKDLFVELDRQPNRVGLFTSQILDLVDAFAAAPVDAGGVANPDGQPGINLHLDLSGDLVDGSGELWTDDICSLNSSFYNAKAHNFDPNRSWVFRYGILALPCDDSPGGLGEVGGNDFAVWDAGPFLPGTVMHELGHTLSLLHGGDEDHNCKPNYLSVMNYHYAAGIPQASGYGSILDYSPPRFPGGRGEAPLRTLYEDDLNEPIILDRSDSSNHLVFIDGSGSLSRDQRLDQNIDWNGDGDTIDAGLTVNIDTSNTFSDCMNNSTNSTLTGHDDWSNIILPIRPFGDSESAALNLSTGEPTLSELTALVDAMGLADLSIEKIDSGDPAVAGGLLTYLLTVANNGPHDVHQVEIVDTLPAGTTYLSDDAGCSEAPAGTIICELGSIENGETRDIEIVVVIDADLVFNHGSPVTITNTADVRTISGSNLESDPDNNVATETTQIVAEADLEIVSFAAADAPSEILIGESITVMFEKVITNSGPSAPMDVDVSVDATPSAGISVTAEPASPTEALALAAGELRTIDESFTLECTAPGAQSVTFSNTISPLRPDDADPEPANNSAEIEIIVDCVVPVAINIKPGSFPNPINLKSKGVTPLAVLTTAAGEYGLPMDFDATTIDPLSVLFGPADALFNVSAVGATESHSHGHIEDAHELDEATLDDDLDMVLHFRTQQSGLDASDTEACVRGSFTAATGDIYTFFGCDAVLIKP